MTQPRYLTVAQTLIQEIREGRWPVGSMLPTEFELCDRFAISRHTVREALRRLRDAGMVERRQGSGTRVAAREPRVPFEQRVGSIEDLLQYGNTTRFDVRAISAEDGDDEVARWLDQPPGDRVIRLHGMRRERHSNRLLAVTDVFVPGTPSNEARYLASTQLALSSMLRDLEVSHLGRVEQAFSAIAMPTAAARELGVKNGAPALAAVRRYFDRAGRLILVARSIHPGDSFQLSMTLGHDVLARAQQGQG